MSVIFLGGALTLAFFGGFMLLATQYAMTEPLEEDETPTDRSVTAVLMSCIASFVLLAAFHYIKLAYGL
ncbi:membrane protein [Arthrobacter phage Mimi]|nr:hypothetical protein PBI_MIMI_275 [Arthrobacter phage Mimi]